MQKLNTPIFKTDESEKFKYKLSKIFLIICVLFFTLIIYINVTYSIAPVNGFSMYPTLNALSMDGINNNDSVVLNYIKQYKKGDIIVAKKMVGSDEQFIYVIKRLIAVGGDILQILSDGTVLVNGEEIEESYVTSTNKSSTYNDFKNYINSNPEVDGKSIVEDEVLTIPKGYVFYLGDNRGGSYDCSSYGPVKANNIIAKVDFIIKYGENTFVSIFKQIFNIK